MIDRFLKQLHQLVGKPNTHRYLLAVSGGADSCVMAYLFHKIGLTFEIAHCNFHLRGEDSNQDMRLVQQMGKNWQVPVWVQEFDTLALQPNSGLSIEMLARELRYNWFNEIGEKFDYIVTAHQADDAAETMLLNLCRGTGLRGMTSIPARNGRIIRPLLGFSAQEIRTYAEQQCIPFAIDYTNADQTIKRNKIRGTVLPALAELNPHVIDTFNHNRKIFVQQYKFYQNCIKQIKNQYITQEEEQYSIQYKALKEHPEHRLLLYEILQEFHFPAAVSDELCGDVQTGKQFLSNTHTLLVNRDKLLILPNSQEHTENIIIDSIDTLKRYFQVEEINTNRAIEFPKDNQTLLLPADRLVFPMELRHWRHGDRFHPLGSKGSQKLSDFFNNNKIDNFTKKKILLLCIGTEIVWIVGFRSSEKFKIKPSETHYYAIRHSN